MTSTFVSLLGLSVILLTTGGRSAVAGPAGGGSGGRVDSLIFGEAASEQAHQVVADHGDTFTGGLGQTAYRLLSSYPPAVNGGLVSFTMKVSPQGQNYVTVKFWGSDHGEAMGRLYLFSGNQQIGWRHLGDVDPLNIASDTPMYPDRFFYTTVPLPLALTQGKTNLPFSIRATGPIFNYGTTYEQYQKVLAATTRGIYRVYTHTDPFFVPPVGDAQGAPAAHPPIRTSPDEETLDSLKANVNGRLQGLLTAGSSENLMPLLVLAKAYQIPWTSIYHRDVVVQKVVAAVDDLVRHANRDPKYVGDIPKWQSFGPAGQAIFLLAPQLQGVLDQPMDDDGNPNTPPVTRRAAWSKMLQASRDYRRTHRPMYSNQAMINDLNLYISNLGLEAVDPKNAMSEPQVRRYLYEAVGILPWLGRDTPAGPDKPMGEHYTVVTAKGLTKELGFTGLYGEVTDWVARIYDATCRDGQDGDPKIKARLLRMIRGRSFFRYPSLDEAGDRAMILADVVGWRDTDLPGGVLYGARTAWEGSAIYAAARLRDPMTVGFAQQMLADGQFFRDVVPLLSVGFPEVTYNLLTMPEDYAILKAQPPSPERLPMTPGQPDFAWADEEDGVLAVKHGDDLLYVSTYWRARYAINNLARVQYITPDMIRIATIRQASEFEPSGLSYTVPDWTDFGFGNGGFPVPGDVHQAFAGETQPIAKLPAGVKFNPGDENSYAGKASFYRCRYGPYLIGMNCTPDKTYSLAVPPGVSPAAELISGGTIRPAGPVHVGPMSTVVLYLPTQDAR